MAGKAPAETYALKIATTEELERGVWRETPWGFKVLLSPQNTPEFLRAAQATAKKYAPGIDLSDLRRLSGDRLTKAMRAGNAATAKASFKGIETPDGKPLEINGKVYENTFEDRLAMLEGLPPVRSYINEQLRDLNDGYVEDLEDAGKN